MYEDKTLVCKDCGNEFVFTAGEQEFYAERGFTNEPKRCKACRDAKRGGVHGGNGFDHIGAHALARWIDDDYVRFFSALSQQLRGRACIHAVKFRIVHAVLCGVIVRVLDRLRDDLDADGLFRVPRKTERDRARAAVKVEYRLSPGQSGQCSGPERRRTFSRGRRPDRSGYCYLQLCDQ